MREHELYMVACVTFLSIFSPGSGKMEQQTCPCCLKSTQPNPHPHIPPDTARASRPLAAVSTASPHRSQPPEHRVPRCVVLLQVDPCYPTVPTALLHPSKALGLPPAGDTSHGHCYQVRSVMRTNVCVDSGLQLGFCVYKAELVFLFIF